MIHVRIAAKISSSNDMLGGHVDVSFGNNRAGAAPLPRDGKLKYWRSPTFKRAAPDPGCSQPLPRPACPASSPRRGLLWRPAQNYRRSSPSGLQRILSRWLSMPDVQTKFAVVGANRSARAWRNRDIRQGRNPQLA